MLRSLDFVSLIAASFLFATSARAEGRAIDVEAAVAAGPIANNASFALQGAIDFRATPALAVGVVGSIGAAPISCSDGYSPGGPLCDSPTWTRVAAEGRWYPLAARFAHAWLGGEVGVERVTAGPETRAAPVVGAGAGVALLPVPALSIGLETRAQLAAFDHQTREVWASKGLSPGVFFGLVVGAHVPLGD